MLVKIGLRDNPRVMEIDTDDLDGLIARINEAKSDGTLFWAETVDGARVAIPGTGVAFVEAEPEERRGAGF